MWNGTRLYQSVNWWQVYHMDADTPSLEHLTWGEGMPIHVYYDSTALHNMQILEFCDKGEAYQGFNT